MSRRWVWAGLDDMEREYWRRVSPHTANQMIENGIGTHALPLGIAINF